MSASGSSTSLPIEQCYRQLVLLMEKGDLLGLEAACSRWAAPSSTMGSGTEAPGPVTAAESLSLSHESVVTVLLRSEPASSRLPLLHCAAMLGQAVIVEFWLRLGADPWTRNTFGWTAWMYAAYHGHWQVLRNAGQVSAIPSQPLSPGSRTSLLGATSDYGITALHCAILRGHMPCIHQLVHFQAPVNPTHDGAISPLMMAAQQGHLSMVLYLLQHGADVNVQCKLNGWTALMYACYTCRSATMIRILLDRGADPNVKTWFGMNALDLARKRNVTDVIHLLESLSQNNTQEAPPPFIGGASLRCILDSNLAGLSQLLQANASATNEQDPTDGSTPLTVATMLGDFPAVKLLLDKGARTNQADHLGYRAIHYAAVFGHTEVLALLLDAGDRLLDEGFTPEALTADRAILGLLHGTSTRLATALEPPQAVQQTTSESKQAWMQKLLMPAKIMTGSPTANAVTNKQAAMEHQPRLVKKKTRDLDTATADIGNIGEPAALQSPVPSDSAMILRRSSIGASENLLAPTTVTPRPHHTREKSSGSTSIRYHTRSHSHHRERSGSSVAHSIANSESEAHEGSSPGATSKPSELYQFLYSLDLDMYFTRFQSAGTSGASSVETIRQLLELSSDDLETRYQITNAGHRKLLRLALYAWKREETKKAVNTMRADVDKYCNHLSVFQQLEDVRGEQLDAATEDDSGVANKHADFLYRNAEVDLTMAFPDDIIENKFAYLEKAREHAREHADKPSPRHGHHHHHRRPHSTINNNKKKNQNV